MIDNKMRWTFVVASLLVLIFFVWQIKKEYNPPYLSYQKTFKALLVQKTAGESEIKDFKIGVRQRWIDKLNRVDRCETCHLGIEDPRFVDAPQPFTTHPDPDTHTIEKFGCTVCHGGQGLATSLEDSHGPVENWHNAIYHKNLMENSCSLCHGEFIQDQAPVLAKGREIFKAFGCRGCHKVDGIARVKTGPPLIRLGEKVKRDWLYRWLINPEGYLKKTRMPDFKPSKQEAADMVAYIFSRFKAGNADNKISGSSERGKRLFGEFRCLSCHAVEGKGGDIGPDLTKVSSKLKPQWLYRWIKTPHSAWSETKMPDYGLLDQEVSDIVTFIGEEYSDFELEEGQVKKDLKLLAGGDAINGKELIKTYGCTGCHEIEGVEDRGEIGPELTTIGDIHISRLGFGEIQVAPENRTVANWLYNKMRNPRLFKKELKMPDYHFSDLEVAALTTYLLSRKGEEISSSYILPLGAPPSDYAPQGEFGNIIKKYRCLVCHKINGKGGDMATDLSQEGSRVRKAWLKDFMKIPDTIRPILVDRMPRFHMSDSEIETVYSYFRNVLVDDRVENLSGAIEKMGLNDPDKVTSGKDLYYEKYACQACHQIDLKGGFIGPDLTKAGERLRPEWIAYYLRDPKAFLKRSVKPVFNFTETEIRDLTAFLIHPKEKK
ncbi:MAG: c-type cytochrome [Desulfobacterales bacterium]|nr:c-type cytochrome [Desulfobacterales bacterium]